MSSWKRTATQYRDALLTEVTRMGSGNAIISMNIPLTQRGAIDSKAVEPRDVGVAIYFSRKVKEDFSWQEVLEITDPIEVTEAQIQESFKRLASIYHPDKSTGDIAIFQKVAGARDNALRWLRRETNQWFSHVIACDQFRDVRLNLAAIVMTIKAIRQIERCGTSSLLDRAFAGFAALPEHVDGGTR